MLSLAIWHDCPTIKGLFHALLLRAFSIWKFYALRLHRLKIVGLLAEGIMG